MTEYVDSSGQGISIAPSKANFTQVKRGSNDPVVSGLAGSTRSSSSGLTSTSSSSGRGNDSSVVRSHQNWSLQGGKPTFENSGASYASASNNTSPTSVNQGVSTAYPTQPVYGQTTPATQVEQPVVVAPLPTSTAYPVYGSQSKPSSGETITSYNSPSSTPTTSSLPITSDMIPNTTQPTNIAPALEMNVQMSSGETPLNAQQNAQSFGINNPSVEDMYSILHVGRAGFMGNTPNLAEVKAQYAQELRTNPEEVQEYFTKKQAREEALKPRTTTYASYADIPKEEQKNVVGYVVTDKFGNKTSTRTKPENYFGEGVTVTRGYTISDGHGGGSSHLGAYVPVFGSRRETNLNSSSPSIPIKTFNPSNDLITRTKVSEQSSHVTDMSINPKYPASSSDEVVSDVIFGAGTGLIMGGPAGAAIGAVTVPIIAPVSRKAGETAGEFYEMTAGSKDANAPLTRAEKDVLEIGSPLKPAMELMFSRNPEMSKKDLLVGSTEFLYGLGIGVGAAKVSEGIANFWSSPKRFKGFSGSQNELEIRNGELGPTASGTGSSVLTTENVIRVGPKEYSFNKRVTPIESEITSSSYARPTYEYTPIESPEVIAVGKAKTMPVERFSDELTLGTEMKGGVTTNIEQNRFTSTISKDVNPRETGITKIGEVQTVTNTRDVKPIETYVPETNIRNIATGESGGVSGEVVMRKENPISISLGGTDITPRTPRITESSYNIEGFTEATNRLYYKVKPIGTTYIENTGMDYNFGTLDIKPNNYGGTFIKVRESFKGEPSYSYGMFTEETKVLPDIAPTFYKGKAISKFQEVEKTVYENKKVGKGEDYANSIMETDTNFGEVERNIRGFSYNLLGREIKTEPPRYKNVFGTTKGELDVGGSKLNFVEYTKARVESRTPKAQVKDEYTMFERIGPKDVFGKPTKNERVDFSEFKTSKENERTGFSENLGNGKQKTIKVEKIDLKTEQDIQSATSSSRSKTAAKFAELKQEYSDNLYKTSGSVKKSGNIGFSANIGKQFSSNVFAETNQRRDNRKESYGGVLDMPSSRVSYTPTFDNKQKRDLITGIGIPTAGLIYNPLSDTGNNYNNIYKPTTDFTSKGINVRSSIIDRNIKPNNKQSTIPTTIQDFTQRTDTKPNTGYIVTSGGIGTGGYVRPPPYNPEEYRPKNPTPYVGKLYGEFGFPLPFTGESIGGSSFFPQKRYGPYRKKNPIATFNQVLGWNKKYHRTEFEWL